MAEKCLRRGDNSDYEGLDELLADIDRAMSVLEQVERDIGLLSSKCGERSTYPLYYKVVVLGDILRRIRAAIMAERL